MDQIHLVITSQEANYIRMALSWLLINTDALTKHDTLSTADRQKIINGMLDTLESALSAGNELQKNIEWIEKILSQLKQEVAKMDRVVRTEFNH
jgi:hypothetical protein